MGSSFLSRRYPIIIIFCYRVFYILLYEGGGYMNTLFIILAVFVGFLAVLGVILGVILYGVGELIASVIWLIIGVLIIAAILKKMF